MPELFLSFQSLISLTVGLSFPGYLFNMAAFHTGKALGLAPGVPEHCAACSTHQPRANLAGRSGRTSQEMQRASHHLMGLVGMDGQRSCAVPGGTVLGSESGKPLPPHMWGLGACVGETEGTGAVRATPAVNSWSRNHYPEV